MNMKEIGLGAFVLRTLLHRCMRGRAPIGRCGKIAEIGLPAIVIVFVLLPSLCSAQMWSFGPRSLQTTLKDPQLDHKAAGITQPQRDVALSGVTGIAWGTDVRFIPGMQHVGDADVLGGIAQYVLARPLTHFEKIPVDRMLYGFWNGMFCHALIELGSLKTYLAFKQRFTTVFGPPSVEKNGEAEKCSWRAKYAIILMRFDGPKGQVNIWSDELYQKMVGLHVSAREVEPVQGGKSGVDAN